MSRSQLLDDLMSLIGVSGNDLAVTQKYIARLGTKRIIALSFSISALLPRSSLPAKTKFEFIASKTFVGSRSPCGTPSCRLNKVQSLSQFAALYADKVLIPDPFEMLLTYADNISLSELRNEFNIYLSTLFEIAELVDEGLIAFAESDHYHFCRDCYSKYVMENQEFKQVLKGAEEYLDAQFRQKVQLTLCHDHGQPYIRAIGPESLIEHGSVYYYSPSLETGDALAYMADRKQISLRSNSKFSRIYRKSEVHDALDNFMRQNFYSLKFGLSALTSQSVEIDMLNSLGKAANGQSNGNPVLSDAFAHSIPSFTSMPTSALISLRQNEGAAFVVYRNALSKAIDEADADDGTKYIQIFQDIVEPELSKMNAAVRNSRLILKQSLIADAVLGAGFVTVGSFGGILPANISSIIAALGGFHYTREIAGKILDLLRDPAAVRENKFYFLWKAQKAIVQ